MQTKHQTKNNAVNAYLYGIITAVLICILLLFVLTYAVMEAKLGEGSARALVPAIVALVTVTGSQVSWVLQKRRSTTIVAVFAVILAILLLLIGLILEGPFEMVEENLLGIGVGCAISYLFCLKRSGKKRMKKRGYR